jgi:hypothetical protein
VEKQRAEHVGGGLVACQQQQHRDEEHLLETELAIVGVPRQSAQNGVFAERSPLAQLAGEERVHLPKTLSAGTT